MIPRILFWLLLAINGALFALGQGFADARMQRTEPQRLARQLHPEQLVLVQAPAPSAASNAPSPSAAVADRPADAAPSDTRAPAGAASPAPASAPAPATVPAVTPVAPSTPASPSAAPAVSGISSTPSVPAAAAPSAKPAVPEKLLACVEIGNFDPNEARAFRSRLAAAKLHAASQSNVREVASYMVYIAAEDGREGAERRAAELRRLGLTDFYIMPASAPMHDAISLGLFKTEAAAKAYIGQLIPKGVRSARIAERTANTSKVAFRLRDLNAADQAGFAEAAAAFPNQSRRDCSG